MVKVFGRVGTFLSEVREEMKQVAWPTREEVLSSALVVFIGVAILATYISILDLALSHVAKLLLQ